MVTANMTRFVASSLLKPWPKTLLVLEAVLKYETSKRAPCNLVNSNSHMNEFVQHNEGKTPRGNFSAPRCAKIHLCALDVKLCDIDSRAFYIWQELLSYKVKAIFFIMSATVTLNGVLANFHVLSFLYALGRLGSSSPCSLNVTD